MIGTDLEREVWMNCLDHEDVARFRTAPAKCYHGSSSAASVSCFRLCLFHVFSVWLSHHDSVSPWLSLAQSHFPLVHCRYCRARHAIRTAPGCAATIYMF